MRDAAQRFWIKVAGGDVDTCWNWVGAKASNGYGSFAHTTSHRWAYIHLIGDVPAGLDLDHLCRNRACCNPWHLDPVTRAENLRRGIRWTTRATTCRRGHEDTRENTGINNSTGYRFCKECARVSKRAYKARQRMSATSAVVQYPTQPSKKETT